MDKPQDVPQANGKPLRRKCGPKPKPWDPDLVQKISDDIALGLTHEQACYCNNTEPMRWEKALQRNPWMRLVLKKTVSAFLKRSLEKVESFRPIAAGTCWILERRYRDQFARQGETMLTRIELGLSPEKSQEVTGSGQRFGQLKPLERKELEENGR